jgi:hypothetical protein
VNLTQLFTFFQELIVLVITRVVLPTQVEHLRHLLPDLHLILPHPVIVVRHEVLAGVLEPLALDAVDPLLMIPNLREALIAPREK